MAKVLCRSCKAKITQNDTTCPRCGSPTSRLVSFVLAIAVVAVAFVMYAAFRESTRDHRTEAHNKQSQGELLTYPMKQTALPEE